MGRAVSDVHSYSTSKLTDIQRRQSPSKHGPIRRDFTEPPALREIANDPLIQPCFGHLRPLKRHRRRESYSSLVTEFKLEMVQKERDEARKERDQARREVARLRTDLQRTKMDIVKLGNNARAAAEELEKLGATLRYI